MGRRRALFVETTIRADIGDLWRLTQDPGQHQRWDLRFTRIEYLPVSSGGGQDLRYSVRLLPGLWAAGTGVCAGEKARADGTRTSVLSFCSGQRRSLIRSGRGFWQYVPTADGIRFRTGYDYRPGWGRAGVVADRLFRPLIGWATAWSFDRLRIWLEDGVPPERSLRAALRDAALRLAWLAAAAGVAVAALPIAVASAVTIGPAVATLLAPPSASVPSARRCAWGLA
jgi:hypothetical protein